MKSDLKERTEDYALSVIRMYCDMKKDTCSQVLGKQVLRSGTSVGAHYAEGSRARSDAEFISKIGGLLQEVQETEYWRTLIERSGHLSSERSAPISEETRELNAIFSTISKKVKAK